jgi:peptidoglycan hydrolase-like protein with peptidoglycan-binding domain
MSSTCILRIRHRLAWLALLLLVAAAALLATGGSAAAAAPGNVRALGAPAAGVRAAITQPVLRWGSTGTAVITLQQRLATLHYDVGAIDGSFGSDTYHAVVCFQKVNGLTRDGVVGSQTWAALSHPVVPVARHYTSGYGLEINLSRQVTKLIYRGTVARLFDTSTGAASTPTPIGSFRVYNRIDGWRQSSLGLLWRPNYFLGGYAVHGSTSVPTYPASHGCVRLTIAGMNRLWPKIAIGTPVWIYRS